MAEVSARDAKLIQYLTEAYGKEKQLETALEADIGLTTKASYKKRLQDHLKETRQHAREVERRIKKLGGAVDGLNIPVPQRMSEVASDVLTRGVSAAQKGMALAQGPVHALRGSDDREKMLKNAKDQYSDEAQEIATYRAIETLADLVGDRDTRKLARAILRQELRMASFLEKEIPRLTKSVAQAQIPASERGTRSRSRRRTSTQKPSTKRATTKRRVTGSRSTARASSSRSRSTSARSTSGRSTSRGSGSTRGRSTTGRSSKPRTTRAAPKPGSARSSSSSRGRRSSGGGRSAGSR